MVSFTETINAGHKTDIWPQNMTLTLNFGASKYPDVQVHMQTSIQKFNYMALLNFSTQTLHLIISSASHKGKSLSPPPSLLTHSIPQVLGSI